MALSNMRRILLVFLWAGFLHAAALHAQATPPSVTLTEERDFGFGCPVAAASEPGTTVFWVLMDNCFYNRYSLHALDLFTGEPLRDPLPLPEIDGNLYLVDSTFASTLTFSSNGELLLMANNSDTYEIVTFIVDTQTGSVTVGAQTDAAHNALVITYSEFIETTHYSHDRAYAVVFDELDTDILDMTTETLLFTVDALPTGIAFSADNQRVYLNLLDDPEDFENYNTTLSIYSLPDGALISSLPLRVSGLYPSPDDRYLVYSPNDGEMSVIDLETGVSSPVINIDEGPSRVQTCLNTGNSTGDAEFTRDGEFPIRGVAWLPDNDGFFTVNTYGGDGAGGGVPCIFDTSRLRVYSLSGG